MSRKLWSSSARSSAIASRRSRARRILDRNLPIAEVIDALEIPVPSDRAVHSASAASALGAT
jgi:hypothetical protein